MNTQYFMARLRAISENNKQVKKVNISLNILRHDYQRTSENSK